MNQNKLTNHVLTDENILLEDEAEDELLARALEESLRCSSFLRYWKLDMHFEKTDSEWYELHVWLFLEVLVGLLVERSWYND